MTVPVDPFPNFVNGTNADADQVDARFLPLYATLDPAQVGVDASNTKASFAKDNVEPAFSTYKPVVRARTQWASVAANTFLLQTAETLQNIVAGAQAASVHDHQFYLDPADFAAGSRVTKLRLGLTVTPNNIGTGANFTVGLYPVASYGGLSGTNATVSTLGSVVAGSQALLTSPGAAAATRGVSGDFTCPTAGQYVLAVVTSGTGNANSLASLVAALDMRQV